MLQLIDLVYVNKTEGIGDLSRYRLSCLGSFGFHVPKDFEYLALSIPDKCYS